jgi:hypothetical protein
MGAEVKVAHAPVGFSMEENVQQILLEVCLVSERKPDRNKCVLLRQPSDSECTQDVQDADHFRRLFAKSELRFSVSVI